MRLVNFSNYTGKMMMIKTEFSGTRTNYDMSIFEKHVIKNGITVWLQRLPIHLHEGGFVAVFLPHIGSQLDPENAPGTAHFFEHLPFRGTRDFPSRETLITPIEKLGGDINACTYMDQTVYFVEDLFRTDFDVALHALFDMVMNPLVRNEDVVIERSIIGNEYRRRFKDPNVVLFELLNRFIFGDNHPFARLVLGTLDSIESMDEETLRKFHKVNYHAGNIQLVVGGGFSMNETLVFDSIERRFGFLPRTEPFVPVFDYAQFLKAPDERTEYSPGCARDSVTFLYPFSSLVLRERIALGLFRRAISYGLSSPLSVEIRERRGWTYEGTVCRTHSFNGRGAFAAYVPASSKHFGEVRGVFEKVVSDADAVLITKRLEFEQRKRRSDFSGQNRPCKNLPNEIVMEGKPMSEHEEEELIDSLDMEEVLVWKDRILGIQPKVLKVYAE